MSATPQSVSQTTAEPLIETPLTAKLGVTATALTPYQGALTPNVFSALDQELASLTTHTGIYDLGYKAYLKITGADRLRWLNGMVSNTIQALPDGCWNYNFLLNAQGRIQGDANIYRNPEFLVLQTDRSQIDHLFAHLDHFIIMDDVELQLLDASCTSIGIAGPDAPEILTALGLPIPDDAAFTNAALQGSEITLVHAYSPLVTRFALWLPVAALPEIWSALQTAGATPCGIGSAEALRILEATPLYGLDIQDRHLAQETAQTRAINFNKGCYLGQEIVERIRSRATVHRKLTQFSIGNAPASLPAGETIEINAEGAERNPVGELTSLAHYSLRAFTGALALGFIRTEAVDRHLPLTHSSGGSVTVLDEPPSWHK